MVCTKSTNIIRAQNYYGTNRFFYLRSEKKEWNVLDITAVDVIHLVWIVFFCIGSDRIMQEG